jgi:hypothetical protein
MGVFAPQNLNEPVDDGRNILLPEEAAEKGSDHGLATESRQPLCPRRHVNQPTLQIETALELCPAPPGAFPLLHRLGSSGPGGQLSIHPEQGNDKSPPKPEEQSQAKTHRRKKRAFLVIHDGGFDPAIDLSCGIQNEQRESIEQ